MRKTRLWVLPRITDGFQRTIINNLQVHLKKYQEIRSIFGVIYLTVTFRPLSTTCYKSGVITRKGGSAGDFSRSSSQTSTFQGVHDELAHLKYGNSVAIGCDFYFSLYIDRSNNFPSLFATRGFTSGIPHRLRSWSSKKETRSIAPMENYSRNYFANNRIMTRTIPLMSHVKKKHRDGKRNCLSNNYTQWPNNDVTNSHVGTWILFSEVSVTPGKYRQFCCPWKNRE